MAEAILDIRLDTVQPNRVRLVYGVQNDYNSRYLCVRFLVNGAPLALENTASVRINAKRPDGTKNAFPGTVNADGTAKVPVAQWMLDVPGEVTASVAAVTTNGALTTQEFYIMAKASVWDGTDEPSEENPDKDVLQTIIASENERVAAEAERVANENARITAETARAEAETQRLTDEAERVQAETLRVATEEERAAAETKRDENETVRVQAEALRVATEEERAAAETKRDENEAERVQAETLRVAAEEERAAAEQNRVAAWANAEGIQQILKENVDSGKKYGYQLKIEGGKPKLYINEI